MDLKKVTTLCLLVWLTSITTYGQIKTEIIGGMTMNNIRHNQLEINRKLFPGISAGLVLSHPLGNKLGVISGADLGMIITNSQFTSTDNIERLGLEYLEMLNNHYFKSNYLTFGVPLYISWNPKAFQPFLGSQFFIKSTRYKEADFIVGHSAFNFSASAGFHWIISDQFKVRLQYNRALNNEWRTNDLIYTSDEIKCSFLTRLMQ